MTNDYVKQAETFLTDTATTFSVRFLEHGKYFPDDDKTRDIWEVTLVRGSRSYSFRFGQSLTDSAKPRWFNGRLSPPNRPGTPPSSYDVLACLTKNHPGTLDNFCADMGYDLASRKAVNVYKAVLDEYLNLSRLYSDEELDRMSEIA